MKAFSNNSILRTELTEYMSYVMDEEINYHIYNISIKECKWIFVFFRMSLRQFKNAFALFYLKEMLRIRYI